MSKIWILFSVLVVACGARENPFAPLGELNSSVMTSNERENFGTFDKQDIDFPKDTNVLLGITIKYRADDGSIKEKVISNINKKIDKSQEYALMPEQNLDVSATMPNPMQAVNLQPSTTPNIAVSAPKNEPQSILDKEPRMQPVAINETHDSVQQSTNLAPVEPNAANQTSVAGAPQSSPAPEKESNLTSAQSEKKPQAVQEKASTPVKMSIREALAKSKDEEKTTKTPTPAKAASQKTTPKPDAKIMADMQSAGTAKSKGFDVSLRPSATKGYAKSTTARNLRFEPSGQTLKITTKDQNIKHFVGYEKNKIVLDFAAATPAFDTKSLQLNATPFKSATIGWHKGYYRVVIVLDKARGYELRKLGEGYEIGLK